MISAEIFAGLCIVALGGWAWTLTSFARSTLPMANAMASINRIDTLVDERIARTFERIKARRDRRPAEATSPTQPKTWERAEATNPLTQIFGVPPITEQPDADDAGLEVVEG